MLLHQLKKVAEIDHRISTIHQELTSLYQERLAIVEPGSDQEMAAQSSPPSLAANRLQESGSWINQTYDKLFTTWGQYKIEIPKLSALRAKLSRAKKVIDVLSEVRPELAEKLTVLLVPPKQLLPLPVSTEVRVRQGYTDLGDYIHEELLPESQSKNWRVVVVYSGPYGIYLGTPRHLLEEKTYMIGGYDTRGLGITEYSALSLQSSELIDEDCWTLLLKKHSTNKPLACGGFMNGRYRFDTEDIDTVLEDNLFRPAVEI